MSRQLEVVHIQALDFWIARGAIVLVAGLQLLVINDLSVGPRWLAPGIEIALLVPLSIATAWNQDQARRATSEHHWDVVGRHRRAIRRFALVLTAVVSLMNFGALIELVRYLLAGKAASGPTLLLDALNIWATNVIAFALWFWSIDRGGPSMRGLHSSKTSDFLFPQMTLEVQIPEARFSPGFIDYLFLSFTNATAFSPTDTLPLSQRAKLLMMVEASISLLTVALVAARAVNILS
ncbi:hypothetical protein [Microvirga sp. M2]|uniref:hypothetical protein n=1 Tax=Microvirga sp. M2 TaxID=3073270 RepID=UPI0039C0A62F